jgi:hypothetical protein
MRVIPARSSAGISHGILSPLGDTTSGGTQKGFSIRIIASKDVKC